MVVSLVERKMSNNRLELERSFHDQWADEEDVETIDVLKMNEACTSPEIRYISKFLGDVSGKEILDLGCGLGEVSVYMAIKGAKVTASDLSPGMLKSTQALANKYDVKLTTHLSSAESLGLDKSRKFDVIYAGNLLHHVEIDKTLGEIISSLKPEGRFVSWDPLAYNPIINIYRRIATKVRTPDEHPLSWSDIKRVGKHFDEVERRYFWFFTLIIFILMVLFQFRSPNKVRFWKAVVKEENSWKWLYYPLELLDKIVITILPPLRLLCWNVVIIGKKSK